MKAVSLPVILLSAVSMLGATAASVTTLAWDGAFPAPAIGAFNGALAEARGWSAVTLLVAVPLLGVSMRAAVRGSMSARVVWLGVLAYLFYSYLEFAVSPPFTALYLVYIATFACAVPAAFMLAASLDPAEVARALGDRAPRRSIAAFGLVSGVGLTLAWLKGIVTSTLAGHFNWPSGIEAIGHVVHALDLGLQVPLCIAAAILLLRRRPAGYLVGGVMLVNSVCMGVALVAMVGTSAVMAGRSAVEALPFAIVPSLATILALSFFRAPHDGYGSSSAGTDTLEQRSGALRS